MKKYFLVAATMLAVNVMIAGNEVKKEVVSPTSTEVCSTQYSPLMDQNGEVIMNVPCKKCVSAGDENGATAQELLDAQMAAQISAQICASKSAKFLGTVIWWISN